MHFVTCTPSRMDKATFVTTFGGIYEHSPWVAERAWEQGIGPEHDAIPTLHALLANQFLLGSDEEHLAVIRAHPDLAGKAAQQGELTAHSSTEQTEAGLAACSAEERERFHALNHAYRQRFGFPFIMAVKGQQRQAILETFAERLENTPAQEFANALGEINRIAWLRLSIM